MPTPARMRDPHRLSANETPSRPSLTQSSQTRFGKDDGLENVTSKANKGKGPVNQPPAFNSLVDSFNDHSPVKTRIQPKSYGDPKGKGRIQNMEEMFPPIERPEVRPPTQVAAKTLLSQQRTGPPVRELPVADWGDDSPDLMLEFDQGQETQDVDAVVEDMMLQAEGEEPLEVMDMKDQVSSGNCLVCFDALCQSSVVHSPPLLAYIASVISIYASDTVINSYTKRTARYSGPLRASLFLFNRRTGIQKFRLRHFDSTDLEIFARDSPGSLPDLVGEPRTALVVFRLIVLQSIPLAGLLNLFATICLFLPGTTSMLLPSMEDESPPLLSVLSAVFRTQCTPSSPYTDERSLLIRESLNLFEVLCLSVPKDSSQQYAHTCTLNFLIFI
jgi:hypothetical protein